MMVDRKRKPRPAHPGTTSGEFGCYEIGQTLLAFKHSVATAIVGSVIAIAVHANPSATWQETVSNFVGVIVVTGCQALLTRASNNTNKRG